MQLDQPTIVSSEGNPDTMDADAALQRKLRLAAIICGSLSQDVIKVFGEGGVTVQETDGLSNSFTRVWDLEGVAGDCSQASVTCSVHKNGALKVSFTKNIAEHLMTDNDTTPASDGTPAVVLCLFYDPLDNDSIPQPAPERSPVPDLNVKVKNPAGDVAMYGYWQVVESLVPGDPKAVPYHTYPALSSMVRALCSV